MPFDSAIIKNGKCAAEIIPERGAIISRLTVDDMEVLYLDPGTLEDANRNVRGGIPILFPFAGKLNDDTLLPFKSRMTQHGFARRKPWSLVRQDESSVRLALIPDAETRSTFPFEFLAEQTVTVFEQGLHVDLRVVNTGREPLPLSPGWHPYYFCPHDQKCDIESSIPGFHEFDLNDGIEFDFGVSSPASGIVTFTIPGLGILTLSFAPLMRHLQFWSLPKKDFVCIEPCWGPDNCINTENRAVIAPSEEQTFWMCVTVTGDHGH